MSWGNPVFRIEIKNNELKRGRNVGTHCVLEVRCANSRSTKATLKVQF